MAIGFGCWSSRSLASPSRRRHHQQLITSSAAAFRRLTSRRNDLTRLPPPVGDGLDLELMLISSSDPLPRVPSGTSTQCGGDAFPES